MIMNTEKVTIVVLTIMNAADTVAAAVDTKEEKKDVRTIKERSIRSKYVTSKTRSSYIYMGKC